MSQKYEKLKTLLKELFQLDQPELDFGIYRILHARNAEVTQFLDKDLLPQVKQAFAQYRTADKAELEKELAKAIEAAQALGVDPESTQKVKDLRARLASDAVDTGALEAEVYDHLYSFFRRYYSEGDFLSKRVYKPGVYAIPYEGEEVKLHWANADQYYIKTSEYLRDYAFRLRPEDEANPMRVHFKLADAAEGEHGNVKEQAGKERRFVLAPTDFLEEVHNGSSCELEIRFEYRPVSIADWPEERRIEEEKKEKPKPPSRDDLVGYAVERILAALKERGLQDWLQQLAQPAPTEKNKERTLLQKHLEQYVKRNTFDYFIHKDLGGFLRRELDFYIKNEVMHLDDVESETAPRVEQYLSKIKVIRRIAHKIIDFLAQLEDFQKKLWLKKKFVIDTQYCVTLDRVPEELYPVIAANGAQREEWVRLFGIDTQAGYSVPLTPEFLAANQSLVVDTVHLSEEHRAQLISAMGDLSQQIDGIAIHADNFQGLSLAGRSFANSIQTSYIDPPFNTGDDFFFKDAYRFSSWLAFLHDRHMAALPFLAASGSHFLHLDHNANFLGRMLLDAVFGPENFVNEIVWRIGWVSGYKTQVDAFVRNHDTIFFYAKSRAMHRFNKDLARIQYRAFERNTIGEELDSIMRKWGVERRKLANVKLSIKYFDGTVFKLGLDNKEAGYNIEDTWNCNEYEELNSNKIKRNASEYTPHGSEITQKPEELLKRVIELTTSQRDWVLDYFGGSGTTAAVALKLGRRFLTIESEKYFDSDLLWRIKQVLHGQVVGISRIVGPRASGIVKYLRLESYEDTLNNLELRRTEAQQSLFDSPQAQGADGFREQYLLRYMLDVETRGSQSLLNVSAFMDPTAYKLKVKRPGSDESREVNVDLLETFNWLIGLKVDHIAAPRTYSAAFRRDADPDLPADAPRRLLLDGRLKEEPDGPWWFRTVTGTTPDGRRTLVIWRKRPGGEDPEGIERDNLVLDEWFRKQGYSSKDSEFDLIYVNGDNNLENLKAPDDTWKVRLIEEDFFRLMFEMEGV